MKQLSATPLNSISHDQTLTAVPMQPYTAHETAVNMEDGWLGWLNWCNAELSLKRYWRGPRSQEVGELTWCLTSTETMKFIRDGEKGGGGGSMEVEGRGRLYTYRSQYIYGEGGAYIQRERERSKHGA